MAKDVWEYFEQRKDECDRYGLVQLREPKYIEKAGTHGQQGRIFLRLGLTETASIHVMERVRARGNSITRDGYAYYLVINGRDVMARDRDSVHDYHGHGPGPGHERLEAPRVTFKKFVEMAWEVVEREEDLAGAEGGFGTETPL